MTLATTRVSEVICMLPSLRRDSHSAYVSDIREPRVTSSSAGSSVMVTEMLSRQSAYTEVLAARCAPDLNWTQMFSRSIMK